MVGKKTKILAIGGDCNYALCYKKLIDKNLGRAAVVVDCFDSFEGAYRRLQKSTYDYYWYVANARTRERWQNWKK